MGEERRFRSHFQVVGERRRQRIHDDRRLYRARSPAQCWRSKKNGPQAIGRSRGGLATTTHPFVETLTQRGITPVIPPKANRNIKRECDFALYCERNLVERFFNLLKHFRAIATRYDKLARNFLAGVQLAAVTILLN